MACKCQECAQSPKGSEIFNPPLTFVIDTTKSVKPDKDSIFNLTQKGKLKLQRETIFKSQIYTRIKFIIIIIFILNLLCNCFIDNFVNISIINLFLFLVVNRIIETNVNIPNYQLVTFNDYGPDINRNVKVFPPTQDVIQFR